ncbi:Trimeric intracellular cation channel type B [Trichinella pseudospiralis]|uniref:Trimeric intracellular cation channel type B n=1 Tax=Trichinella pseudospiralis TaxID=6337 RepID=A0A0V0XQN1_TRIPS|nr:Trimeric intracellular cation channel type B [Trichinella pseudospiralis]
MLEINANLLPELSKKLISLKLYPYFDIAHYIMMTMSVREDLGSGAVVFSRKHPLSCWFSSMLMCFAGFILSNFLLGEPIVTVFMRHSDVLLATTVWYIVFYSPFDIAYKTVKNSSNKQSVFRCCARNAALSEFLFNYGNTWRCKGNYCY